MRNILGLAAALGAAAIGESAAAQSAPAFSGGGGGAGAGPSAGAQGGWSSAEGRSAPGGHRHLRQGWSYGPDRRRGRHHDRPERHGFHPYGAYGAAGIPGPVEEADPHGNGFFAGGGGGGIRLRGGRPYYDYDRAYPYEWASAVGRRQARAEERPRAAEPRPRCTIENSVRVCRGW
jgi:hypothetical protein